MEITFLGTGSTVPTKERNVSAQFLSYKDEGILIDCGEGTQRQMNLAGINRNKVTKVLITHWHGDHTSGLVGLIQTVGNAVKGQRLMVFGPPGTKHHMEHLLKSAVFEVKLDIDIREVDPQNVETIYETSDYKILAAPMEHSVPCIAYRFVEKDTWTIDPKKAEEKGLKSGPQINELKEKGMLVVKGKNISIDEVAKKKHGKNVAFIFDTALCQSCYDIAKDADVLVCEATHLMEHEEKAIQYQHLTTKHAAVIASTANVKKLIATHFSQRYKTTEKLEEELTGLFPNTVVAQDFMKLKL
ncbi:MAG: ribonuclease Z [Candidatus Woesearchaeota archaeon]